MAKFCKYCGTPLKEGAKFCPKCGKPVQAAALPAEAAPQAAQVVAYKAETNPKKRGKGGLIAACVVAILALGGGAAWYFLSGDKGGEEQSSYGKPSAELVKQGYAIDLPESAGSDIRIEKVEPETLSKWNLIGQPVNVTRGGDRHVQLEEMAHVSFPIPADIAREDFIDLMGVLIVDGKPVYMVPEYEGLCNGMVSFETSHFCYAGMTKMEKEKRRNEFINRIAATEWVAGMSEKNLQKTVKQRLTEVADGLGLGEHTLMGMAVREVVSDIGFVKDATDLIDSYDNGEPGEMEAVIAEKITYKVQEKVLAVFFNKLKGDIERNVVTYDPDTKRITRTKEVEKGKYSDYISALEKELGRENMQELGEKLDKGESLKSIAKSFIKKKAVSWAKDFSTKMIPQIKIMQAGAKAMGVVYKFWTDNQMNDLYERYRQECDGEGRMQDGDWNALVYRVLNTPMSKFNMTEEQIRQQFEERFRNQRDIDRKKDQLRTLIAMYEDTDAHTLINAKIFDKMGLDYIQRLTRIHMLVERFRTELCDKSGNIPDVAAGKDAVNLILCDIVEQYLKMYPDTDGFYVWLEENGYYGNRYKKLEDGLNAVRSWWLVDLEVIQAEDSINAGGLGERHSASELQHQCRQFWNGEPFQDLNDPSGERWYRPFTCTSTATLSPEPPEFVEAGDTLLFHVSLRLEGSCNAWTVRADARLSPGFERNLVGSTVVGASSGEVHSGEWDVLLPFQKGRKGATRVVIFSSCGNETRWTYQWGSLLEISEVPED